MPLLFCSINDVCNYASRTLTSYWLATTEAVPMMPARGNSMLRFISRCSVCTASGPVLTLHAQSTTPPRCPQGWSELWTGFSFLMVSLGEGWVGVGVLSDSFETCAHHLHILSTEAVD